MLLRFKWNSFTGIVESEEEPEQEAKDESKALSQMAADFADAEQKTKAFLDGVHVKERRYLEAYDFMHKQIENARSTEQRQLLVSDFDQGHMKTLEYRDKEVRNRDSHPEYVESLLRNLAEHEVQADDSC